MSVESEIKFEVDIYHFQCRHKYHRPYKDEANVTDKDPAKKT